MENVMRDIKFRAWTGERMINRTLFDRNWYSKDDKCVMVATPRDARTLKVMQFTGLKDKNGIEIYEGDIVVVNESHKLLGADFGKNKRVVQWRGLGACLDMLHVDYLNSERKVGLTFDNGSVDSIEVIGNIHENPELLN
jgi:uncharacterized phage protein (TIGR01671 family)